LGLEPLVDMYDKLINKIYKHAQILAYIYARMFVAPFIGET